MATTAKRAITAKRGTTAKRTTPLRRATTAKRPRAARPTAPAFTTIDLATAHGVAVIWLNRPEVRNAFNSVMLDEIGQALDAIERDASVRAVVLAARGTVFSAGADVKEIRPAGSQVGISLVSLLDRVDTFPKPVIARVQGSAFGGAVALVCACDIAIAVTGAEFSIGEVRLGFAPGAVAPYVVRAIGERPARRWCLTGERFTASEAWRIGMLHELVAEPELDAVVNAVLGNLVLGGPQAITLTKQLIAALDARPLTAETMHDANRFYYASKDTPEAAEGLAAFRERRAPRWVPTE